MGLAGSLDKVRDSWDSSDVVAFDISYNTSLETLRTFLDTRRIRLLASRTCDAPRIHAISQSSVGIWIFVGGGGFYSGIESEEIRGVNPPALLLLFKPEADPP